VLRPRRFDEAGQKQDGGEDEGNDEEVARGARMRLSLKFAILSLVSSNSVILRTGHEKRNPDFKLNSGLARWEKSVCTPRAQIG
jgi:hypothetical protein